MNEKITDKKICEILENEGCSLTSNPYEAIYIMRNGNMISGDFQSGSRGEDHRMIECCMKDTNRYDEDFWSKVHTELGVVALVPETQKILAMKGQDFTMEQWDVMNSLEAYELEEYCEQLQHDEPEQDLEIEL